MATAGKIFTVLVVYLYIYQGRSNEGTNYSGYVLTDLQSSSAHIAPVKKPLDLPKRYQQYNTYQEIIHRSLNQSHIQINSGAQFVHSSQTLHDLCFNYHEYRTLLDLKDNESCLRSTDVWPLLESLSRHGGTEEGPKCRVHLIHQLSDAFGNIGKSPDYCQCSGHVEISHFPGDDYQNFQKCWNHAISTNNYYQSLYHEYYSDHNNHMRQYSHHHIWYPLSQIHDDYCQRNLVINLAHTFRNNVSTLQCSHVSSVHASTRHAESTTVSTVTPITTYSTTIYKPLPTTHIAIHTCDKYATISSLLHGRVFSHPSANDCVQGDHRASEAFVVILCHTNGTHNWTKGPAVMDNCSQIPLYTPVATFYHESFISNGGQAGIFLGCLTNGFKLAAQECFTNSTVLHIENGGLFARDPSLYHVVLF